jgi:hypothetical protein
MKQIIHVDSEDGGNTLLRNIGIDLSDYMVSHLRRQLSSNSLQWEPEFSHETERFQPHPARIHLKGRGYISVRNACLSDCLHQRFSCSVLSVQLCTPYSQPKTVTWRLGRWYKRYHWLVCYLSDGVGNVRRWKCGQCSLAPSDDFDVNVFINSSVSVKPIRNAALVTRRFWRWCNPGHNVISHLLLGLPSGPSSRTFQSEFCIHLSPPPIHSFVNIWL